ncbi:Polyamine transporter 1 [Talaromyces islandicus]|uniref:Polyamine transporter 1 n=1 Tax=Talaromyces islandicus TaxID=28573 RepID=A0A0U1M624_TALIS|nr:Polyamine transporter 1 [Talaromyces islandicus]
MSLDSRSSDAQAIEYLYLEMDAPLPIPSDVASPSIVNPGPQPDCPDLEKYTSPFVWPESRKSMMTATACSVTALAGYAAGEMGPAAAELTEKWNISNVVYQLNITIFCIGFATAPMVLAPFSEINGRRPIFIASGVLFVASLVGCGGTGSFAGLLVARLFEGIASSTFSTMVGGIISDIYHADDRNTPMALFAGSALFGTGLSPLISSVIQTRTSWRWIYYSHAIAAGIFTVIIYAFFEETRGSVLLSRKARALNKYYEEREKSGYYGVIMSMDEKAVFNYLADTYHRYASSAIAAQSFCRNMLGGAFPLVTQIMFKNLGYPAASSLLGGIGAALTLVPWVLLFFGSRIRAKSRFASVS